MNPKLSSSHGENRAPASAPGRAGTLRPPSAKGGVLPFGGGTASRPYVTFPDFAKEPMAFIDRKDAPFAGDLTLMNGFFLRQEKYPPAGMPKGCWSVNEPGADTIGCALTHGHHRGLKAAILSALALKPMLPLAEQCARVEAWAKAGVNPDLLLVVDDLLDDCRNVFGPLDEKVRDRIKSYLIEPGIEAWEDIKGFIISAHSFGTVWTHCVETIPGFPRSGASERTDGATAREWTRIPTPTEVVLALRHGALANAQWAQAKSAERRAEVARALIAGYLQTRAPVVLGHTQVGDTAQVSVNVRDDARISLGVFPTEQEARTFCRSKGLPIEEDPEG